MPDAELVAAMPALIADLRTYGYRRDHALLCRQTERIGRAAPIVKRIYRVIKLHGLLLQRHSGRGEEREHRFGQVDRARRCNVAGEAAGVDRP